MNKQRNKTNKMLNKKYFHFMLGNFSISNPEVIGDFSLNFYRVFWPSDSLKRFKVSILQLYG